jgi:hypothetical protein
MDEKAAAGSRVRAGEDQAGWSRGDLFGAKGGRGRGVGQEPRQKMFAMIFWGSVYMALLVLVSVVGVREWLKKHRNRNTCCSERKGPDGEKETARINNR